MLLCHWQFFVCFACHMMDLQLFSWKCTKISLFSVFWVFWNPIFEKTSLIIFFMVSVVGGLYMQKIGSFESFFFDLEHSKVKSSGFLSSNFPYFDALKNNIRNWLAKIFFHFWTTLTTGYLLYEWLSLHGVLLQNLCFWSFSLFANSQTHRKTFANTGKHRIHVWYQ